MSERIDNVDYRAPRTDTLRELRESTLFITSPGEFICKAVVDLLRADPVWATLFGDSIEAYAREDWGLRNLPALNVSCEHYRKEAETWYVHGTLVLELIWPPAIRRIERQQLPATVAGALLQQFRRPSFFDAVGAIVPGLNELGKTFDVDNSLVRDLDEGEGQTAPITRIMANFRLDLNAWDEYVESDYRTKDDPFSRPLGDLKRIVATINALNDDGSVGATVGTDQTI